MVVTSHPAMLALVAVVAISSRPMAQAQLAPSATSTLKMSLHSPLLIPKLVSLVGAEVRCPGAGEEGLVLVADEVQRPEAGVVLAVVVQRHVDILLLEGEVLEDHNLVGEAVVVDGEIGTRFVPFLYI